jgi:hypothetical protein
VHASVRLTRAEFEDLVRPSLQETLGCLRRALASAAVDVDDLSAVLLAGGSSRIPLVAELLSAQLGRPLAVDALPSLVIALGAASYVRQDPPRPAPHGRAGRGCRDRARSRIGRVAGGAPGRSHAPTARRSRGPDGR